jgi:transposase-like protein
LPMNLIDVTADFATEDACLEYLERSRWNGTLACLKCGSTKVARIETKDKRGKMRRIYQCNEKGCFHQFTATTGTIFHDTHLPLRKWFMAIALIADAKKGMSANQMSRHLGCHYRTAWFLCHRIRKAMEEAPDFLRGTVEVDETYLGGRYDKRRKRDRYEKIGIIGLVERKSRVQAKRIIGRSKSELVGIVRDRVLPSARVMTDQFTSYQPLSETHRHDVINHIQHFAQGDIHTNTIENFWSLLKRGIIGSFHKVSTKHLDRYLAEFTYRFNRREMRDLFEATLLRMLREEPMKYSELTANDSAKPVL